MCSSTWTKLGHYVAGGWLGVVVMGRGERGCGGCGGVRCGSASQWVRSRRPHVRLQNGRVFQSRGRSLLERNPHGHRVALLAFRCSMSLRRHVFSLSSYHSSCCCRHHGRRAAPLHMTTHYTAPRTKATCTKECGFTFARC